MIQALLGAEIAWLVLIKKKHRQTHCSKIFQKQLKELQSLKGLITLTISVIYITSYPSIYLAPKQNINSMELNEISLTCQKP